MLMRSPDACSFIVASPHARSSGSGHQGRVSAITPDVSPAPAHCRSWGFGQGEGGSCTGRWPLRCTVR